MRSTHCRRQTPQQVRTYAQARSTVAWSDGGLASEVGCARSPWRFEVRPTEAYVSSNRAAWAVGASTFTPQGHSTCGQLPSSGMLHKKPDYDGLLEIR